jgi:hypothetical protein
MRSLSSIQLYTSRPGTSTKPLLPLLLSPKAAAAASGHKASPLPLLLSLPPFAADRLALAFMSTRFSFSLFSTYARHHSHNSTVEPMSLAARRTVPCNSEGKSQGLQ